MRKFGRLALGLFILLMPTVTGCSTEQCEITCSDGYRESTDGRCGITDSIRAGELRNQRKAACSTEDND